MNDVEMFAGQPTTKYRVWLRRKNTPYDFERTNTTYLYRENADAYVRNQFPSDNDFWEAEVRAEDYNP